MKYFLIILVLITTMDLTACSYPVTKDKNSYFYSVPVGTTLTLNKEIIIPANLARRYFQNGESMNEKGIDIYYPHCNILMNTLAEYSRTIKPTVFEIYRVIDEEEHAQRPVYFASTNSSGVGGPSIIAYSTYYYLRSKNKSDVRSLECLQWGDPYDVEYLSINEIKKSLGDYFTLDI